MNREDAEAPMVRRVSLLAVSSLAGCSHGAGLWILQFEYPEVKDDACASDVEENFIAAQPKVEPVEEPSDWATDYEYVGSDSLAFARIITTTRTDGALVMGGQTWPGTRDGNEWKFRWADSGSETSTTSHISGYFYAERETWVTDVVIDFALDGADRAAGKAQTTSETSRGWQESDTWSEDAADELGTTGAIPASAWLDQEGGDPVTNDWEGDECSGDMCELADVQSCAFSVRFKAARTDLDDDEITDDLTGATSGAADTGF